MSKSKIERIREIIAQYGLADADLSNDDCFGAFVRIEALRAMRDLAEAWILAEARAREAEHDMECHDYYSQGLSCTRCQDWIAVVKREVGWVED